MPDMEKVIERIHEAIDMGICVDLFMDVLELLKEQEAVVPLTIDDSVSEIMDKHCKRLKEQEAVKPRSVSRHGAYPQIQHYCGNCNAFLPRKQKYCSECGRSVKWE